jgi:carnitine 3-dehydrogenase
VTAAGLPRAVGLLGGGVIGAGWAARFLLNGVDVRLYDPDPQTPRRVDEVLAQARRASAALTLAPLPPEGRLELVDTPEEAVEGAQLVQESAPERVELKQELLRRAERAAAGDAVLASSTSGLLPTLLQARLERPERLCVGHPFNPVYLLPLVEVVPGGQTAPETCERAAGWYRAAGMEPMRLRREIDGFVADRLQEALWREALWLVEDDVATVEEIDDALRLGAGLRWAFMGSFLTYRIAGGEAGMRHFMAQFGPALQWPWTHLTDVPELTDDLLERIVAGSDAQARGRSVRELERVRDDCLVAVLQALRGVPYGAGETLARYEEQLRDRAPAPLRLHRTQVDAWRGDGTSVHEHYGRVLGEARDAALRHLGADAASGYVTVETLLRSRHEAAAGDELVVETRVLEQDAGRLRLVHRLLRAPDELELASGEHGLEPADLPHGGTLPHD